MAYITNGTVTIFLPGTTAGIATIEFEDGLIADFQQHVGQARAAGISSTNTSSCGKRITASPTSALR